MDLPVEARVRQLSSGWYPAHLQTLTKAVAVPAGSIQRARQGMRAWLSERRGKHGTEGGPGNPGADQEDGPVGKEAAAGGGAVGALQPARTTLGRNTESTDGWATTGRGGRDAVCGLRGVGWDGRALKFSAPLQRGLQASGRAEVSPATELRCIAPGNTGLAAACGLATGKRWGDIVTRRTREKGLENEAETPNNRFLLPLYGKNSTHCRT